MINTHENSLILPSKACLLPNWGLILVEGVDASNFLQNQLTNSVLGMRQTQPSQLSKDGEFVRLVGYCNAKGRLMASAWLALFPMGESKEDRFALFISKDIAAAFAKRLAMYVLRSKVKVTDVSNEWQISGMYGSNLDIDQIQIESGDLGLRLPNVLIDGSSYARALIANKSLPHNQDASEADDIWNYLEVMSAIPRIVLTTQEKFVPQMVNFESVAGVDFKKGCYPGQEVVARSQYRGAIKRRLQLAHSMQDPITPDEIAPGVELFHTSDPLQPAGMVVLSAKSPVDSNRVDYQIECKLEALQEGEIHLGNINGPVLKIDPLPYPLIEI